MKKKLLALLLCLALSLSLSACGSSQTTGVMSQVTNTSGSNDDLPVVKWKMASTWGSRAMCTLLLIRDSPNW